MVCKKKKKLCFRKINLINKFRQLLENEYK